MHLLGQKLLALVELLRPNHCTQERGRETRAEMIALRGKEGKSKKDIERGGAREEWREGKKEGEREGVGELKCQARFAQLRPVYTLACKHAEHMEQAAYKVTEREVE